ncbi:TonB-dependent receptor domain-containing protein [Caulobacter segnis]
MAGAAQQTTVKRDYDDILPALNLTAEVTPDVLLRFGAAKVMTRPNLGSLTPGGSLSTVGVFGVSSGNPYLKPIRATTYDLSAEWYFAKDGLLSVGLFYKDIKSYIQTSRISQPFSASRPADQPAGRPGRLGQRHLPVQPAGQHRRRPAEGDRGRATSSRSASCPAS